MTMLLDLRATVLIATSLLGSVLWTACASSCPLAARPHATVSDLQPGEYRIRLTAAEGSRRGAEAVGRLWLFRDPAHWSETKLFGRLEIDLDLVGAPMSQGDAPAPGSSDPEAPGVLVLGVDFDRRYPPNTPVLVVGTGSNRNQVVGHAPDGSEILEITLDGPGIGLWIHHASKGEISGRWSEWGILVDGRGTFCASRVP